MEKCDNIDMVIFDFDGTIVSLKVDWESLKKRDLEAGKRAGVRTICIGDLTEA